MENKETKPNEPIQIFVPNSTDPNLSDVVKSALSRINNPIDPPNNGLTKREYFAALAMQGLLPTGISSSIEEDVKNAVKLADLLIEELNKPPQN